MKILSISNLDIWPLGENKGIPSVFASQKEFVDKGHKVSFLCPLLEGEQRRSIYYGIQIYRFGFPFNYRKIIFLQSDNIFDRFKDKILSNLNWLLFQIYSLWWAMKIGYRLKPDVIYAHSLTSAFPAYLVSRFLSAKLIIRAYGTRQLYWKWESPWFRIKEFRDYLVFKIPADYFIITDDGNFGNRVAKKLGVPDEKIRYWRNGIEQDFYESEPNAKKEICQYLHIDSSLKIIASTCRLIPDYRVDELIKSLISLFRKNNDAVCLVAGDGEERHRLEELVRKNDICTRFFFLGMVDRKMIKKILNAADIFVLLSKFHNCTNTMWEAMASGKCIVTTKTDSIREILTPEENAIFISSDDLRTLSTILEELLNDKTLRDKLGQNAQLKAHQVLEPWSKRIEKELVLLEDLVKK